MLKRHYRWSWMTGIFLLSFFYSKGDDGHRLWLKYDKIENAEYLKMVSAQISSFKVFGQSEILTSAREELKRGLTGLLGKEIKESHRKDISSNVLIAGTPASYSYFRGERIKKKLAKLPPGGYMICPVKSRSRKNMAVIANDDIGVLYGIFHFLRLLQTQSPLEDWNVVSAPRIRLRMLNHWDNPDGSVERGYAGKSLWKWNELPEKIDTRYRDYARANASVGINAVVLNNVNADPKILEEAYLQKIAALATVFRPYGIKVFLSANFASPKVLEGASTADPLDKKVQEWWRDKAAEIYRLIPDFGGFLVKANSEGQPGPQDYGRTHAEGANMMASALKPHNGILIWRAFVYAMKKGEDRAKMAYEEFKESDGKFDDNVLLQIKNGPLDFQPREPFSPLFGAMPHTNEMMEFQITQEYLGHDKALVYLAPLFRETLQSDTYAAGKGTAVAKIIDGSIRHQSLTGMAGVANTGDDRNWTGYVLGQANWYAFGRLAWNPELTSGAIAKEWIQMTLTHYPETVKTIQNMMLSSRDIFVDYQTPLGLNVLTDFAHYGPKPDARSYYHQADNIGLGFDRTTTGSNAVSQYFPPVKAVFNNIQSCPEQYLCWFHHVPWNHKMLSDRTFWEELCYKYDSGVKGVESMLQEWNEVEKDIDKNIFIRTKELLTNQLEEAKRWKETCLEYFSKYSGMEVPKAYLN